MTKLLAGLALWTAIHLLKRIVPNLRRDMDSALGVLPSKGVLAALLLVSAYLLTSGYRSAEVTPLYTPFAGAGYLNNLLMLPALFIFAMGKVGGRLSAKLRHPMLWGLILWSISHLLVNGDLASVVLFAGLGLWAVLQMYAINQHEGPWERPMPGNSLRDWKLGLAALFVYFAIAGVHWLFGLNPFEGTYS